MMNGLTLTKSAAICGIRVSTAFIWRHKILDALQNMANDVQLDGIVEADETFFDASYKGNHRNGSFTLPRKAHKRGHSTHTRGISNEKVCVPCAVNRSGLSIAKITNTGKVSIKALHNAFDGRFRENAILVTDQERSYVQLADTNGITLVQIKGGKTKNGIYHIQHANSYHSQLKQFMRSFKGVSSKYLNNYLIWHNFVNYAKETTEEKRNILLAFVLSTFKTDKCRDIAKRPAMPLLA
jgi:transposase-like protein